MNEEQAAKVLADLSANEAEHRSFRRRLDDFEGKLQKQNEILIAMERQGNAIERVADSVGRVEKKVTSIDDRVALLEKEPGDKWKKIGFESVKYIVLALVGLAVGYLLSRIGGE